VKQRPDNWNRVYSRVLAAEKDHGLLGRGDRVLIALSGGADSLVLLDLLSYQRGALGRKLGLTVVAGHVPGSFRGRPIAQQADLRRTCERLSVDLQVSDRRLGEEVFSDCFACSRARRRLLFDLAERCGCNKIALGHNADDLAETALLNILFAGHFAAMRPRQPLLNGRVTVIRPLSYVWKSQIAEYCAQRFGPVRQFACPGGKGSRRLLVRKLLARLEQDGSPVRANVLKAIFNPKPDYLPLRSGT